MIKFILWSLFCFLAGAWYNNCEAEQVTYSNQYGQVVGYLSSKDGVATYSNAYGQVVGYAAPQPQMFPTTLPVQIPDLYKLPELPALPLIQLQPIFQ